MGWSTFGKVKDSWCDPMHISCTRGGVQAIQCGSQSNCMDGKPEQGSPTFERICITIRIIPLSGKQSKNIDERLRSNQTCGFVIVCSDIIVRKT
jgi:hypothetical protein